MKQVFVMIFVSFCFWVAGSVMTGGLAHAESPTNAKLNEVLEKLDAVSCAASGFIDNLDGTLCDCTRNLMWEKKTGTVGASVSCTSAGVCPDPNDVNNLYTWSSSGEDPDGTVYMVFLAQLNDEAGGGVDCFAGHCDWRLPKVNQDADIGMPELDTIVDMSWGNCGGGIGACINPIFGPTSTASYWSSTTDDPSADHAWSVRFLDGAVNSVGKNVTFRARAVRPCE